MKENTSDDYTFLVNKTDLSQSRWQRENLSSVALEAGQVLAKVEKFALTANNMSYAVTGEKLGYWRYFASNEPDQGIIPVWGYASVIASRHDDIPVGERLFGYLPMATHLLMQPEQVKTQSFIDQYAHRRALHESYNTYTRLNADPVHVPEYEDLRPVLWGLFATSFLMDGFLAEEQFFSARQVVVVSASSKTAVALAFLLSQRKTAACIGLTSAKNKAFVEALGFYDQVLTYDEIERLSPDEATVCVDFSGNGKVLSDIHHHLGDQLKYSSLIGKSHWTEQAAPKDTLPGPRPRFFFAPDHVLKQQKEWGEDVFIQRLTDNWKAFADAARRHYRVEERVGRDAIAQTYREVWAGNLDPAHALICSF